MTLPAGYSLRTPVEADHPRIIEAIPVWWDTPNSATVHLMLPRLFLQFFTETSAVVEDENGELAAFHVGFLSPDDPRVAYIHFVGVSPSARQGGIAKHLYERFFAMMKERGASEVQAITGPWNRRSQAFHVAMGFEMSGDTDFDGVRGYVDYDGPGEPRVKFVRPL